MCSRVRARHGLFAQHRFSEFLFREEASPSHGGGCVWLGHRCFRICAAVQLPASGVRRLARSLLDHFWNRAQSYCPGSAISTSPSSHYSVNSDGIFLFFLTYVLFTFLCTLLLFIYILYSLTLIYYEFNNHDIHPLLFTLHRGKGSVL